MAQRKFNSVEGFSVGVPGNVIPVIDNVANVYANRVFVQQYANLGDVGNIYIGGGTNNQVLKTNGSGNLFWALDTAPAGGNATEVQFNTGGSLDASSLLTFNKVTGQLTVSGNLSSENATLGNLATANFFNGNGSLLTSITATNINGQVSNANLAWQVYNNAQPNITSVGTLSELTILGTGTVSGANVISANYFTGTLTTAEQPNITSLGTLTTVNISGNITSGNASLGNLVTANYFSGNGSLLTGIVGNANYAAYAGNITIAQQPNITSVGALSSLSVTGLITATGAIKTPNVQDASGTETIQLQYNTNAGDVGITANLTVGSSGTGNLKVNGVSDLGPVSNVKITGGALNSVLITNGSGELSWASQISNALVASTVYSNAQPNITSVGTLNGVNVSAIADFTSASNVSLGPISNVHISGGTSGYVIQTNGSGGLSWVSPSSISVAGLNKQVQFNNNGSFGASANFSFDPSSNTLSVDNFISASGNILGANLVSANYITGTLTTSAQPNITSVGVLNELSVTGNALIAGNLVVTGTTTYTNVDRLAVKDPIIELGGGANGDSLTTNDGKDRGSLLHYYTTAPVDAFMGWDNSNGEFAFGSNVSTSSEVVTFNSFGNVRAGYFIGNGSQLTGVIGSANYAAYAGNVTLGAQPNITSVGTLTSANITGNVTSGNATLGNLVTANYFSGDGSLLTNLTSGSRINNGTSNVNIPSTNSNVTVSVNGTSNVLVVANNSATLTGNLYVSSNIVRDNKNVPTYVSSTAAPSNPVTGDQWYDQVNDITYQYIYDGTSHFWVDISSGYVASNVNAIANTLVLRNSFGNVYANGLYANVLNVAGISNLGPNGNVRISGGTSGQYLQTDGAGNLSWSSVATGSTSNISNGTSNVNAGVVNGNVTVGVAGTSNVVIFTSTGVNVAGYLNTGTGNIISGNAVLGNLASANYISGNGTLLTYLNASNIGSGTIPSSILGNSSLYVGTTSIALNRSSGSQSLTGVNIDGSAGSATTAGTVTTAAQPNITSVGTLVDANISGNLVIGGNLTVSGSTEYTNVTNLYVKDPIIEMGANSNGGALTSNDGKDRGSLLHYYTTKAVDAFMGWDNSNGEFAFGSNVSVASEVVTFNTFGNVRAGYFIGNASQLSGINASNLVSGTISSSILGNSTVYVGTTAIALNRSTGSQTLTGVSIDGSANYATYAGTVTTNAQPNITSVGTLTSVSVTANVSAGNVLTDHLLYANGVAWNFGSTYSNSNVASYLPTYTGNFTAGNVSATGNVTAQYFIGNGSALTSITGGNVTGQVSNALIAGTVYTAAQPNITSVGTLSTLHVSGNANVDGVLFANSIVGPSSANVTITAGAFVSTFDDTGNITLAGNVSTTANVSAGNIKTDHLLYANGVAWDLGGTYSNTNVANYLPTYTGDFTAGNISATGNITASYLIGNGSQLTGLPASYANSNVAAYLPTYTGDFTAGNISATGNITANYIIGNGSQLTGLPASYANSNVAAYLPTYTGNISANYFIGNGSTLTHITGGNVDGQVGNALVAGTVYTNAQPNITSTGTLTSLNVDGLTDLGPIGNITIDGGSDGYVLKTDGSGTLSWVPQTGGGSVSGFVSMTKDRYLTTGSANTFTLNTTPGSKDFIEVVIDGLQQISNTYSLTGNVLSFPTNPAAGQVIEVTAFGAVDLTGNVGEILFKSSNALGASTNLSFSTVSNTLSTGNLTVTGNLTSQAGYVYVENGIIAVSSGNAGIFNTSVANINLGLAANVTIGSTSGNTTIRGNLLANNASITTLSVNDYYSSRDAVTVTTNTIIDQFPVNNYRSAKYTMRVNSDDGYQAVEILLVHDGSSSYVTIYGSISSSGSDIITLSSNIGSGNVRLFASTASTNTNVKILGTYVPD